VIRSVQSLRPVGEVVLAVIVAALVSLGVQALSDPMDVPESSFVPSAVLASGGAVLLTGLMVLAAWRRWRWWGVPLAWVGLSALGTLSLAMIVPGTKFYLNGISADQLFRTQYLTRMASSTALADLNYADLPPYYPAGWFWIGGRFAHLMGLDGWEAYRPFAIITMAVGGVLAFTLWSGVVGRRTAVLLAVVTAVVGLRTAAYEPYSWVLAACLPPVAVVAWRLLRAAAAGERSGRGAAVGIGVYLGVCGAVYTLLFGFVGVLLAAMGLGAWLAERRRWRRSALASAATRAALGVVAQLAVIGAVAAPITLLVWTPYLRALLAHGPSHGAAARFLPEVGALWPVPMLTPSVVGVLTLVGTAWIVLRWRGSPVAQALGMVAAGAYVWFGLSTVALAAGSTLLAFRLEPPLHAALGCAGVLGLLEVLRLVLRRARSATGDDRAGDDRVPRTSIVALAGVLAAAAMLSLVQTAPEEYAWARTASLGNYYPTGSSPRGESDDRLGGAWNDDLVDAIDELTGGIPPERLVILTWHVDLLAYQPYHGFQSTIEQYANPLADFPGRRAAIESWAASRSPAELLAKLDGCPYRAPTVFVLHKSPDGLQAMVTEDTYPAEPNHAARTVTFDEGLFAAPQFRRRDVGGFAVIVRTG
jgi:galactan 5-O-arabinofuranosyltransferase